MGRLKVFLAAVVLVAAFFQSIASAQTNPQNFIVKSFAADYYLDRDEQKTSLLSVQEKIVAQFPDFDQNHGILRAIPQRYQDHTISLKINSVKKADGSSWNYSTYHEN